MFVIHIRSLATVNVRPCPTTVETCSGRFRDPRQLGRGPRRSRWRSGSLAAGEDPEGRIEALTASTSSSFSDSHSMRPHRVYLTPQNQF